MTIINGRLQKQSKEEILDAMIADAKQYWGEDLDDNAENTVRIFYEPIATRLAEAQEDIGLVLDQSQIDYASGTALDLLTALIGVSREKARRADGYVKFTRDTAASTDYTIPSGTRVQTDSTEPVEFVTTETVTLALGTTSVTANIEAVEPGPEGNVGENTIIVIPDPPAGVEDVTNPSQTSGGRQEENDSELRQRAKKELAEGSRASAPALVNSMKQQDGVTSVSIFVNDQSTSNNGLPAHSFELVVAGGNKQDIGQAILDTKAAGDNSTGGVNGSAVTVTSDLPNGQTQDVTFSRPNTVKIHVDATITKTSGYAGNDAVRATIVDYIGGLRPSGNEAIGLGTGDDVIWTELLAQIQQVEGVYDVPTLEVGTSSNPTSSSNVSISASDVATADGTDSSLNITTQPK